MSSLALHLQPTTVPPGPRGSGRPPLRVLQGGRAPARVAEAARFRRRRLVAAVVALGLVVAVTLLAITAVTAIAGTSPTSAVAPGAAGVAAPTVVVQPGDTLWSIAAATAPETDVRIAVDRIVALNGTSSIVVGQELELPVA